MNKTKNVYITLPELLIGITIFVGLSMLFMYKLDQYLSLSAV